MTSEYTPNPANNPTTFEIPDDGDVLDVASILPAIEGIADLAADAGQITDDNTWQGANTFNDTVTFEDNAHFNDPVDFNDAVEFNQDLAINNGWHVLGSQMFNPALPTAGNHSVDAHLFRLHYVPTLSANNTWVLNSPPDRGIYARFVRNERHLGAPVDANTLTFNAVGPGDLIRLPASQNSWVEFVSQLTSPFWVPVGWSDNVVFL